MGLRHSVKREEEEEEKKNKEKKKQEFIQRFIERTLTDGWVQAALGAGRGDSRGAGSSVAWVLTRHRLTMDDVSC